MNIICSHRGLVDIKRPKQRVADIAADFSEISIMFGSFFHAEENEKNIISFERVNELINGYVAACKNNNLKISLAYAPDLKDDDTIDLYKLIVIESIKKCGEIGIKNMVLKPVFTDIPSDKIWNINRDLYLEISQVAKENNVTILLENMLKNLNGHLVRGVCSDPYEAAEWIDTLNKTVNEERFGFCMNTGTCNICGQDMREFAIVLGDRIKAVALRDNDGKVNASYPPFFTMSTDWLGFIRGMREIEFDGVLLAEFSNAALNFPPLLKPQIIHMGKIVAEYMKWQIEIEMSLKKYDSIVLFGAGNMCRNFMKCYGEKYPPKFTCDNNSKLWGTEFCGLEVKNPESLREIPEDCAIFICNVYYREIEAQLRKMGINNKIEYFNDEYMPSYHYDRVKR